MTMSSLMATLGNASVVGAFWAWVVFSLKGTALLGVAWLVNRTLARGSAALRHSVWASALAMTLVLPLVAPVTPRVYLRGIPAELLPLLTTSRLSKPQRVEATPTTTTAAPAIVPATRLENEAAVALPHNDNRAIEEANSGASHTWHRGVSVDAVLTVAWVLGAAVLLFRAFIGAVRLSHWGRTAYAVDDARWLSLVRSLSRRLQIARPVMLLQSDRACVPMTWGIVYPRVLLPADADE